MVITNVGRGGKPVIVHKNIIMRDSNVTPNLIFFLMSSSRESQDGLLELEERIYPAKPPKYDENEPMMLLDVNFRFWTGDNCLSKRARYVFSANMTLEEAMDLAVEKNADENHWTEKYGYFVETDTTALVKTEGLVSLPDTQSLLKNILQDKDKIVISNESDFLKREKEVQAKSSRKALIVLMCCMLTIFLLLMILIAATS